jgi:hypothetical protein
LIENIFKLWGLCFNMGTSGGSGAREKVAFTTVRNCISINRSLIRNFRSGLSLVGEVAPLSDVLRYFQNNKPIIFKMYNNLHLNPLQFGETYEGLIRQVERAIRIEAEEEEKIYRSMAHRRPL